MAVSLSEVAADKILKILKEQDLPATAGLRFGIKGGGCSGFEYFIDVEPSPRKFDMPSSSDVVFVSNGVRILVDKKSLLFMDGTVIDWEEHNLGHQFIYSNPNATGTCGCGTSFAI